MKTATTESSLRQAWEQWAKNPTKENADNLMKLAQPLIDRVIAAYLGPTYVNDPLMQGRAKLIALNALKSYDPVKGPITSHLWIHLQRVQRLLSKQQATIKTPERRIMELKMLKNAEKELEEKLGRVPSDLELADYTKLSVDRIRKIRSPTTTVFESTFLQAQPGESGANLPGVKQQNINYDILSGLYDVSDDIDRVILERYFGYGDGTQPETLQSLSKKLNLSIGAISKRIDKLTKQYTELMNEYQKGPKITGFEYNE